MKAASKYLEIAKKNAGVSSDYGLAKVLGVKPVVISHIRHGRAFTDEMVFKVAELAGVNPAEIIAAIHIEKEKDQEKRKWWREAFEKVHGTAAAVMLAVMLAALFPAGRVEAGQFDITKISRTNNIHYTHLWAWLRHLLTLLIGPPRGATPQVMAA